MASEYQSTRCREFGSVFTAGIKAGRKEALGWGLVLSKPSRKHIEVKSRFPPIQVVALSSRFICLSRRRFSFDTATHHFKKVICGIAPRNVSTIHVARRMLGFKYPIMQLATKSDAGIIASARLSSLISLFFEPCLRSPESPWSR